MSKYIKQLTLDLPRWVGLGYVSEPNAALIVKDAEANQKEGWFRLPMILSMLGGLLVFAGVISWVAGNWDDLPRLIRVIMLVGAMLGSLWAAHYARAKGSDGLAHSFAFLAALMFGADIMLIAQIYQLPANPPGGALLWAMGALAVAVLWPSQMSMALAFVLIGIWSWFTASGRQGLIWDLLFASPREFHFEFLLLWGALAAYSVKRNWTKALHVAGLTLAFWCMHTMFALFDDDSARIAGLAFIILIALITAAGYVLQVARPGAGIVSKYIWVLFAFWLLITSVPNSYRGIFGYGSDMPVYVYYIALLVGAAVSFMGLRQYNKYSFVVPIGVGMLIAGIIGTMTGIVSTDNTYLAAQYSSSGLGLYNFWVQVLFSVIAMAAAVGSIVHGYKTNEKFFINLGFVLFAVKLIWLYFDNAWGLNGRAGFFVVGGLLIVGLGIVFDRQRRKLILKMQEGQ